MAASTSAGENTEKSIRNAAVKAIAKHGFEAASLREIAREVGIRAPSLYNYISSKEQLLYELMKDPLTSMLTEYRALVKEVDDPAVKLKVFVRVHLGFHLHSRLDVLIGNMELRSLSASHYRTISNLREDYARALQAIIEEGVKSGVFTAREPRVASLIMLGMLSGVCNWYQPGGAMSSEEMTQLHTELAFRMLGGDAASLVKPKASLNKAGQNADVSTRLSDFEKPRLNLPHFAAPGLFSGLFGPVCPFTGAPVPSAVGDRGKCWPAPRQ